MVILGNVEETVGETVGGPTGRFKGDSAQNIDMLDHLLPFIKHNRPFHLAPMKALHQLRMTGPRNEFRGRFNLKVTPHLVPMSAPHTCPPGEHPGTPELLQFTEYAGEACKGDRRIPGRCSELAAPCIGG